MARCGCGGAAASCSCTVQGVGGVKVTGNGSSGTPYQVTGLVDPVSGNLLTQTGAGFAVKCADVIACVGSASADRLGLYDALDF